MDKSLIENLLTNKIKYKKKLIDEYIKIIKSIYFSLNKFLIKLVHL